MVQKNAVRSTEARTLVQLLGRFREPDHVRGSFELALTAIPFAAIWTLMWASLYFDCWIGLVGAVPAAGLLVRLFMIQHDCGHGSFFSNRLANDWIGRVIGVMTLTPYGYWRHNHALHHASSGNLDQRGFGDRKSTRLNSSHSQISYAVFCLK